MKNYFKHIIIFLFANILVAQNDGSLISIGPSGGIITAIDGSSNEQNLVVGVKNNGIYYSLNKGLNWIQSNLKNTTVNNFSILSNNNTFLAATEKGIYISSDAGKNWTLSSIIKNVNTIYYHKKTGVILAGVYEKNYQLNGLYCSKNNGQSWSKIDTSLIVDTSGVIENNITAICMDEKDDTTIFIGVKNKGLYASYNFGINWNLETRGLDKPNAKIIQNIIHFYDPLLTYNVIGIGTANGLYISNNFSGSPMNWTSLKDISGMQDNLITSSKAVINSALNRYYFFSTKSGFENDYPGEIKGGLYRVNTLNQSMSLVFRKFLDVHQIFIPNENNKNIYLATSGGIYFSSDNGNNFEFRTNGILQNLIRSISFTNDKDPIMYSSVFGGGVQRSLDTGKTWEAANINLTNPYVYSVVADTQNIGVVYAATLRGIYRSKDYGSTWSYLPALINDSLKYNFSNLGTLRLGKKNSKNIIFSSFAHGINLSANSGTTWIKPNSANTQQFLNFNILENFEFFGKSDSTIIGTANGIWKSFDFGMNWTNISNNLPLTIQENLVTKTLYFTRPKFNPKNDTIIYISSTTDLNNYTPSKIYYSNALGIWNEIQLNANDISIDKRKPQVIFASSENKIYHTIDNGNNWTKLSEIANTIKLNYLTPFTNNPNLQFIGSNNGIYKIEFSSDADLDFNDFTIEFGPRAIGSVNQQKIELKNIGGVILNFKIDSVIGSDKITIAENKLTIPIRQSGFLNVKFSPITIGEHKIIVYTTTNDPKYEKMSFEISGIGIGINNTTSKQKILFDSAHALSFNKAIIQTKQYFSKLINVLTESGFEIVANQKIFSPFGFSSVFIPAPVYKYSESEIDSIQKYLKNGGQVIFIGDKNSEIGNINLNEILNDYRWKHDYKDTFKLKFTNNLIIDSVYGDSQNVSHFIVENKNFSTHLLSKVDKLSFNNAVEIEVGDSLDKLINANKTSRIKSDSTISADSVFPTLIAKRNFGKGRMFLISDFELFSNGEDTTKLKTGILSAKNLQLAQNIFSLQSDVATSLPIKTPNEHYIAFSIPFDLNNFSITNVLKDLGTINPARWRLFKWNVKTGKYIEFPNIDFLNFNRGDGYWLITKGEKNINFGNASSTSATDFYSINLQPGYNLIGNPFPYKISWANSTKSQNIEKKIWLWKETKFVSDTNYMEPFTAYFVKNNSELVETININPLNVSSTIGKLSSENEKLNSGEWKIKIKVNSIFSSDEENYIGNLKNAKDGWDIYESSEPPTAPSNILSLYFNKTEWKKTYSKFSTDFRNISCENNFWDFKVFSNRTNEKMNINFDFFGQLPENAKIFLIDLETERISEISDINKSYYFTTNKGENERNFRLIVGSVDFAKNNSLGIPFIPLEYYLEQNYPNPFNGKTKINYTLSHSGNTKIYIYNILGERIKTIDEGFHSIGKYTATWDGKNDFNVVASSGIYFYKLVSNDFTTQKKMLYLK